MKAPVAGLGTCDGGVDDLDRRRVAPADAPRQPAAVAWERSSDRAMVLPPSLARTVTARGSVGASRSTASTISGADSVNRSSLAT